MTKKRTIIFLTIGVLLGGAIDYYAYSYFEKQYYLMGCQSAANSIFSSLGLPPVDTLGPCSQMFDYSGK